MEAAGLLFHTIAFILVFSRLGQILSFARSFLAPFISYHPKLASRYGRNSWAVITGASSGIGKCFVFELASHQFNIALVGRNREKLEGVDKELKEKFPSINTRIVVENFEKAFEDGFAERIQNQVKDLDVSFLVNNAGGWVTTKMIDQSFKDVQDIVVINALAPALLTRVFLPQLAGRKRSAMINVSSGAADYPLTNIQVYSATKVFVDHLTRGLIDEHRNVDMLSLRPFFVATKLTEKKSGGDVVKPEACVKSVLRSLGHTDYTYGHWKHSISGPMMKLLPNYVRRNFSKHRV